MVTPMLRPDLFGGLATHAGDALFEACYQPDFRDVGARAARPVRRLVRAFWADFRRRPAFSKESDGELLNDWCDGSVLLGGPGRDGAAPVRPGDGRAGAGGLGAVAGVGSGADGARATRMRCASLTAIYIDAGKRDEFYLDLGAEAFRRELEEIGVTDVFFEVFDATHMSIEYRYPLALKYLAERLS